MTYENIAYGSAPRQMLDVYQPLPGVQKNAVIVFFYGGNWQSGDKADYKFIGQTLAAHGILTIIPNYRLYPDSPFPAFINDAALAVKWAHDHAAGYGVSESSLFLMGNGSGASASLFLALDPQYLATVGLSVHNIQGIICVGGFYGADLLAQPGVGAIFASSADANSVLSNRLITALTPPLLIITSRDEDISDNSVIGSMRQTVLRQGGSIKILNYPDLGRIGIMLPFSPLFHNRSTVVDDLMDFISHPPAIN